MSSAGENGSTGYKRQKQPRIARKKTQITCDINGDGSINVLDLQILVNVILGVAIDSGACDLNGDGNANVIDLQLLINVILGITPPEGSS